MNRVIGLLKDKENELINENIYLQEQIDSGFITIKYSIKECNDDIKENRTLIKEIRGAIKTLKREL